MFLILEDEELVDSKEDVLLSPSFDQGLVLDGVDVAMSESCLRQ